MFSEIRNNVGTLVHIDEDTTTWDNFQSMPKSVRLLVDQTTLFKSSIKINGNIYYRTGRNLPIPQMANACTGEEIMLQILPPIKKTVIFLGTHLRWRGISQSPRHEPAVTAPSFFGLNLSNVRVNHKNEEVINKKIKKRKKTRCTCFTIHQMTIHYGHQFGSIH